MTRRRWSLEGPDCTSTAARLESVARLGGVEDVVDVVAAVVDEGTTEEEMMVVVVDEEDEEDEVVVEVVEVVVGCVGVTETVTTSVEMDSRGKSESTDDSMAPRSSSSEAVTVSVAVSVSIASEDSDAVIMIVTVDSNGVIIVVCSSDVISLLVELVELVVDISVVVVIKPVTESITSPWRPRSRFLSTYTTASAIPTLIPMSAKTDASPTAATQPRRRCHGLREGSGVVVWCQWL